LAIQAGFPQQPVNGANAATPPGARRTRYTGGDMTETISGTPVTFVNVADRDRALAFYRDTLGLALSSSDEYGDFLRLEGALLRLTVLPDYKPGAHPVLGWHVRDVHATAAALRGRGVSFTVYPGMGQDELGVWTAPDGRAKVAWFADPDGNVLSLSQG
jgi:catechol 2,3-dioxygenase-like lactoylglutathione lyase family enzyme